MKNKRLSKTLSSMSALSKLILIVVLIACPWTIFVMLALYYMTSEKLSDIDEKIDSISDQSPLFEENELSCEDQQCIKQYKKEQFIETRHEHEKYIKTLFDSPNLSYSLKNKLIFLHKQYLENRNNIDFTYNKFYAELVEKIVEREQVSHEGLIRLTLYIKPHGEQKALQQAINNLSLSAESKRKLESLIFKYCLERRKIDFDWRNEKKEVKDGTEHNVLY